MIYLILSILSSVGIFVIFKIAELKRINLFSIIFINYITATILGLLLNDNNIDLYAVLNSSWLYLSIIIGVMFTGIFFLIGYSTEKNGIAITSVATKLSLVIPVTFSILYDSSDIFSLNKLTGIILALFAVILLVWKRKSEKTDSKFIYLPIIIFIGIGLVDSFVKYAQQDFIDESNLTIFSTMVFFFAGFTALLAGFSIRFDFKQLINRKSWISGLILGILNFGSIFFIMLALDNGNLTGSSVFGVNNMGIILLSVVIALLFFNEKLNNMNKVGILISIISIWLLVQA